MAAVMEEKSVIGLREVVLLIFATCALFMLIALLTFNIQDAGFSHSGSLQSVRNACGVIGAWISDFTLTLFGLMGYCIPLMFGWVGYLVHRDQLHTENSLVIIMRYFGFVGTLAFGSALFYLHLLRVAILLPSNTGGILGQELGDFMILMFGNSGATLFLLVGFLAAITLFTDLSWFRLMDSIGNIILNGFQSFTSADGNSDADISQKEPTDFGKAKAAKFVPEPETKYAPESETPAYDIKSKLKAALKIDTGEQVEKEEIFASSIKTQTSEELVLAPILTESKIKRQEPEMKTKVQPEMKILDKFGAPLLSKVKAKIEPSSNRSTAVSAFADSRLRQEPQFTSPEAPLLMRAEPNLRSTSRIEPSDTSPKKAFPDPSITAKVMGFENKFESSLEEPMLDNFPPLREDFNIEEFDYPPFPEVIEGGLDSLANPFSSPKSSRTNTTVVSVSAKNNSQYAFAGEILPNLSLLDERDTRVNGYSNSDLQDMSRLVEAVLQDFNVVVDVVDVHPGPVITRFELQPAAGVKASRISGLAKDLARALTVTSVRIVENIPGKSVIGLEIPNQEREMVTLRELLVSPVFTEAKSVLTLAMGKDIAGVPVVADLGKMPHALVAGTTGSGKSVAINTMILSLLFKATPEQVRLIMIDPKMLELSVYEGIPHLLTPVVTDMKEASNALRWAVAEMERRYKLMSKMGVRNLAGFNQVINDAAAKGQKIRDPMFAYDKPLGEHQEFPTLDTLPSIVIVIDELADMMMIVGKKVEELIARLAQKARAAGIHLILATQRPSVDVLTGLIKANVPTRISFQVSSRIDSRTILDQGGAETLLGNGDMLFLPSGTSIPIRAHGAFVDDHEVHRVVEFLKQTAPPNYLEEITREVSESGEYNASGNGDDAESDALYDQAVQFVTESRKASISSVQRRFKVGYNRAARMIEDMEAAGVVSPAESNGYREVLAPAAPRFDD